MTLKLHNSLSSLRKQQLKDNYLKLKAEIPPHVQLVVVSKTRPIAEVEYFYELGQRDFGENRVQDLKSRAHELAHLSELRWHFIGHLQTNKINELLKVPGLACLHSVDSLKLAECLAEKKLSGPLDYYLEVNIGDETEKQGVKDLFSIQAMLGTLQRNTSLHFVGLMGMAPIRLAQDTKRDEAAQSSFRKLAVMAQELSAAQFSGKKLGLSMGMSGDYLPAIAAGSTCVRIGSILFL
jgi:hypothetical protein